VGRQRFVVNDGLLAGSRAALCAFDAEVRGLPGVIAWVDASPDVRWRNQFAANVALARLGSAVELDPTWNLQLHVQDVDVEGSRVRWRGRPVRILHFSGWGKYKLAELREASRAERAAMLSAAGDPVAQPSPGETRLAELCDRGRFEDAIAFARELCAAGPLPPRAAEQLAWLEAMMAPPTVGTSEPSQRSWASELPRDVLLRIQEALHHQRYRGRQLVKNPFDIAMYQQLLERLRPATIVEIGSKAGGSALWLAGLAAGLGFDTHVHSYDIEPVTDLEHPGVSFHRGDGRRLGDVIEPASVNQWPRPLLVIEDADHSETTTSAVLEFFHPHLRPGDYVVIEDGNLSDLYPDLYPEHSSGPHLALRSFVGQHRSEYDLDSELCDLFGYNSTTASNGILRRRDPPGPGGPSTHDVLSSRPWLAASLPAEALAVPTMLSYREGQLLHWLARHHVTGVGRIVDGGSFLGGSTAALASGLAARTDGPWDRTIAAYDLFRVEEYTLGSFATCLPDSTIGASFRSAFDANVAPWSQHIEVREGDACAWGWSGEPIEVLFLDMVKTWTVNDLVLEKFLPFLIPGHSVIIQQDYLWGYGHWIHMTMELLEPSVAILDSMPNGSVAYLLTAPVPAHLVGAKLRETLTPARQRILMDRAVGRWQGEDRGLVELSRVMLIAELDGQAAARSELSQVLARHAGQDRVEQCGAILTGYLY
jgi:cephalosporin hydroxylase